MTPMFFLKVFKVIPKINLGIAQHKSRRRKYNEFTFIILLNIPVSKDIEN